MCYRRTIRPLIRPLSRNTGPGLALFAVSRMASSQRKRLCSIGLELGTAPMISRYDFCILGGGLAGSALAILMVGKGARVALVEKTRFDLFRPGEHLPPVARGALRTLG